MLWLIMEGAAILAFAASPSLWPFALGLIGLYAILLVVGGYQTDQSDERSE